MPNPNRDALDSANISITKFHSYLRERNTFPHKDQGAIIRAFFNENKKIVMGQCGRSFGKTHVICYLSWRFCLLNPNSEVYIICPELSQGKRIYWIPRRLQQYGPQEFILEHRDSELRSVFKNGSHIIIAGCENYDSLRGIKPHLVIYDEFQHHTSLFDEEVMQPNLSSGKVSLVTMGTPPRRHCYYVDFRDALLDNIRHGDKGCYYVELPSWCNPTVDRDWIKKKKEELQRKGKINVYLREYEGKMMFDTEHAIFPFFSEQKHVKPHNYLMTLLSKIKDKLEWYDFYDPGTKSVFAGLYIAYNRYTSQVFILDEIYATDKREMTSHSIWLSGMKKREELYKMKFEWTHYYDEAAAWFQNEIMNMFNENLLPTSKAKHDRSHEEGRAGESLLNSFMDGDNKFFVSDRCKKFIWEITNYVVDEQGRYPKKNDHLMDLLFYFINETHVEFYEEIDPEMKGEPKKRKESLGELFDVMKKRQDFAYGIEPDYYDYGEDEIWN